MYRITLKEAIKKYKYDIMEIFETGLHDMFDSKGNPESLDIALYYKNKKECEKLLLENTEWAIDNGILLWKNEMYGFCNGNWEMS